MSSTPFRVFGIVWRTPRDDLPSEAIIEVPNYLTDLGYEDFEEDDELNAEDDQDDEDDGDDEDDEDDENYAPTAKAEAAFDAEWDAEVRALLEKHYGVPVDSFEGFEPAVTAER